MIKYVGNRSEGVTIVLDGGHYSRCVFQGCKIVYRGGAVDLSGNTFIDSHYSFEGPAGSTIEFLKMLVGFPGGTELVQEALGMNRKRSPTKVTLQ